MSLYRPLLCYPQAYHMNRIVKDRFGSILEDEDLYEAFHTFLEAAYAEETLAFYREVSRYEKAAWSSKKDMKKEAVRICEKYLGYEGGDPVLNVGDYLRQEALKSVKKCNIGLFEDLKRDIEPILKTLYIQFALQY